MIVSRPDISSTEVTKLPVEERFIKPNIEKYMSLMNQTPIPPQIALINAINSPKYRFITAVLSRRTGKTHISNIIGQLVALVPGTQILVIAPNYSLSTISWDLQRKLLKDFEVELVRSNSKDKILELTNGSIIRMGSVTQVDSVVGRSYDLIIFDEAALNDDGKDAFNIQLRPTLDKKNSLGIPCSKTIFISTPRGKNWFHEFYMRGFSEDPALSNWASIHATYLDNPNSAEADIESAKATMSKAEFGQEYNCDFVALQGQVWELAKDNIVSVDLETIDVQDTIAGLDVGFKDPTALCVVATDGHNFYVIDEYLNAGKTTDTHGKAIYNMIEKHDIDFVYIDAAAAQTAFDLVMNWDISTIKSKKSILDGIGYVSSIIDNNRLFVDSKCVHTIAMLDNYRWDSRENLIKEKPVHDEYSHMADALRYALYSHSYNMDTF